MRSFLLSFASSIGDGCGRKLLCVVVNCFSGLSSTSVRHSRLALSLRRCSVIRACVNDVTCPVAHALIPACTTYVKGPSICAGAVIEVCTCNQGIWFYFRYGSAREHRQWPPCTLHYDRLKFTDVISILNIYHIPALQFIYGVHFTDVVHCIY